MPDRFRPLPCALLLVLLAGCSGLRVEADYDTTADFTTYDDYAWLAPAPDGIDPVVVNDLLLRRIEEAVDDNFGRRGLHRIDEKEASLLVSVHMSISPQLEFTTRSYGYGRSRATYRGSLYEETEVSQYDEGTLVIDLIDAGTRRLVWRGSAQSRLRKARTPEDRAARIREAVDAILARYPPDAAA